jgi:hypothetical protein
MLPGRRGRGRGVPFVRVCACPGCISRPIAEGHPGRFLCGALVGYRQQAAALRIQLSPGPKNVLNVLAFHACDRCGRAWPGVPLLMLETGLSRRAVQDALVELRTRPELVTVYQYPKGGRGVSTEYIVMPELAKLSTADCGNCSTRLESAHLAHPLTKAGPVKGAESGSKRARQTYHQQSIQPQQSGGEPASEPAAASPDGLGVEPPTPGSRFPDTAPKAPQSPAEVKAFVDALSANLHLRTPPRPKGGSHRGP